MRGGRKVLVTGGCGSIGSSVVDHILNRDRADKILVYDEDEQGLFTLEQDLLSRDQEFGADAPDVEFELGDVRDRERLRVAMQGVDYVVHAAGVKQVPHCETHPYEAARTNVDGTWNVLQVATQVGVESVLTVSTDKAVNPVSTMGASKMLAERLTQAAEKRTSMPTPRFGCVRLGNVLDSAGSVVDLHKDQIRDGGPVTITDPEMTRFAMSKEQAAAFISEQAINQVGGRIHAPKMERFELVDLVDALIQEYAPPDHEPAEIDIKRLGKRAGERHHEYLVGPTELERTTEQDGMYSIEPVWETGTGSPDPPGDLPQRGFRSDTEPYMSQEEILDLIDGQSESMTGSPQSGKHVAVVDSDDPA